MNLPKNLSYVSLLAAAIVGTPAQQRVARKRLKKVLAEELDPKNRAEQAESSRLSANFSRQHKKYCEARKRGDERAEARAERAMRKAFFAEQAHSDRLLQKRATRK